MPTAEQIAPHMAQFLDMLDSAFRSYGALDGLPERFRYAVAHYTTAPLRPPLPLEWWATGKSA